MKAYLFPAYAKVVAWPEYDAPARSERQTCLNNGYWNTKLVDLTVCKEFESCGTTPYQYTNRRDNESNGHVYEHWPSLFRVVCPSGTDQSGSYSEGCHA